MDFSESGDAYFEGFRKELQKSKNFNDQVHVMVVFGASVYIIHNMGRGKYYFNFSPKA
jgi:hypothetical protein